MGVHGAITFYLPHGVRTLRRKERTLRSRPPEPGNPDPTPSSRSTDPADPPAPREKSTTPFEDCDEYAALGGCRPVLHQRYTGNRGDILRCRTCGRTFSSRRGEITFKSRLSEETIKKLIEYHRSGDSIRKAARELGLNRGTVRRYYRLLDEKGGGCQ